jgi:hypothetical protein
LFHQFILFFLVIATLSKLRSSGSEDFTFPDEDSNIVWENDEKRQVQAATFYKIIEKLTAPIFYIGKSHLIGVERE